MQYYIVIFLSLLFAACQKTEINTFNEVKKIIEYDSIFSDRNSPFNTIIDMEIVDSILITMHADDDYNFSLININNGEFFRWGKAGRGPEEYIELGSGFCIHESQLIFLDAAQKEIIYIALEDLFMRKESLNIKKEEYPYTIDFRPRHLALLENRKIATGFFKQGYFGVLGTQNNIIDNTFDYPFAYHKIKGIERGTIFQTKMKVNRKQNKFVIQTLASDVFEIYQVTENRIQRIYTSPCKHIPQIIPKGKRYSLNMNKSIIGLIHLATSDEFICFTYSDKEYADIYKTGSVSNEILCFNWAGEKIKKYILPFPISAFCIDNQYIYGVRYWKDESIVYRFHL